MKRALLALHLAVAACWLGGCMHDEDIIGAPGAGEFPDLHPSSLVLGCRVGHFIVTTELPGGVEVRCVKTAPVPR